MAENAIIKIMTALLKHQVKKLVGEDALGVIGEELTSIGGDKLDDQVKTWLGEKTTTDELEKAADYALNSFREKVKDDALRQWIVMLPIGDLPDVLSAIEELPTSPDETKLEKALRDAISTSWKNLSNEQIENAVNAFMSSLRSALLPLEKQTLMVIGRSVLRIEEKIDQLRKLVENLKPYSIEEQALSRFGNINVGNVTGNNIIIGNNNVIYYYTTDGEKREMRRGWFYGHSYGDLTNFTGRADELHILDEWLANSIESLLVLNAFGGFGKSALTWQWFKNNVDREKWHTAVWWSFYEKEAGFDNFLAETLTYLGIETKERSARQQVNDLLNVMQKANILLFLDGFERLLRQYGRMDAALQDDEEDKEIDPSKRDCTSQSAEVFLRSLSDQKMISKVLITSRLLPRSLEGRDGELQKRCREVNLKGLSTNDAVTYFHNAGIQAMRAEIIEVCSAYGYHPLSLNLLVGLINKDHKHKGDIVVAKNLDIFGDIKAKRYHVLKRAYESLFPERRDLLSKISCFRGSMKYATIKKIFDYPDLENALIDLRERGLLQYIEVTQSYDMHPIVRHFAYDNFIDDEMRKKTHIKLAAHFTMTMPLTNNNVKTLEDLAPVIELYHHMVRAGNLDEAMELLSKRLIPNPLYFQFGAYQLCIELLRALFLNGKDKLPLLKNEDHQGWTLSTLGSAYAMSGQPKSSITLREMDVAIIEKIGNKKALPAPLLNLAIQQLSIGALMDAESNLRRSINLYREISDEFGESVGHMELGRVLSYHGSWQEAEQELDIALKFFKKQNNAEWQSIDLSYCALRFLLLVRINPKSSIADLNLSIESTYHALKLVDEDAKLDFAKPRNYIRAYWLLGWAHCVNRDLTLAEENLFKALSLCRQINMVDHEADILLAFSKLRYAQKNYEGAKSLADEALIITERCGYVLQGADVNLFLSQYALEQEKDKTKAKEYAKEAKKLATGWEEIDSKIVYDTTGKYVYKVAYHEAEAMLEKLK